MNRFIVLFLLSFVLQASGEDEQTNFSIITTKGYISYNAASKWKVVTMNTKPPSTASLFRIPNPADEGTSNPTNLVLMTFETDSPEAMAAFTDILKSLPPESKRTTYGKWECVFHKEKQGPTEYSICDAYKKLPVATVLVRIAWPNLAGNPKDYDHKMEAVFHAVLDSVASGMGPVPKKEGQELLRPVEN